MALGPLWSWWRWWQRGVATEVPRKEERVKGWWLLAWKSHLCTPDSCGMTGEWKETLGSKLGLRLRENFLEFRVSTEGDFLKQLLCIALYIHGYWYVYGHIRMHTHVYMCLYIYDLIDKDFILFSIIFVICRIYAKLVHGRMGKLLVYSCCLF